MVAAILTQPDAVIPILLVMGAGWFVTMNFIQPRVMSSAVGIHPVVVLLSVLIGLRLQGVVGAIGVGMNQAEMLTEFARHADFDCFLLAGRYTLLEQDALDSFLQQQAVSSVLLYDPAGVLIARRDSGDGEIRAAPSFEQLRDHLSPSFSACMASSRKTSSLSRCSSQAIR